VGERRKYVQVMGVDPGPTFDWSKADLEGYGPDGFNCLGWDPEGFGRDGYNRLGWDREGFGPDGYNSEGVDRYGINRAGFRAILDETGRVVGGYHGLDEWGFGPDGLDVFGRTREKAEAEDDVDEFSEEHWGIVADLEDDGVLTDAAAALYVDVVTDADVEHLIRAWEEEDAEFDAFKDEDDEPSDRFDPEVAAWEAEVARLLDEVEPKGVYYDAADPQDGYRRWDETWDEDDEWLLPEGDLGEDDLGDVGHDDDLTRLPMRPLMGPAASLAIRRKNRARRGSNDRRPYLVRRRQRRRTSVSKRQR
jgi:hypothetical protein